MPDLHSGIGVSRGESRAAEAARAAISSPLPRLPLKGAKGVLMNITGSSNMGLFEVNEAAEIIAEAADPDANIIFGAVIDDNLNDEIRVTVIATGFDSKPQQQPQVSPFKSLKSEAVDSIEIKPFATDDLTYLLS